MIRISPAFAVVFAARLGVSTAGNSDTTVIPNFHEATGGSIAAQPFFDIYGVENKGK